VAGDGVVVTNAHVVAGDETVRVVRPNGREAEARVVVFDKNRDLAILAVPGLGLPALPRGSADEGARGAVFGHPGGQDQVRVAPAQVSSQVRARGLDLYGREETERDVFILASNLAPGDSGAAFVDTAGSVVGVAFAIAPDREGTAYALTRAELDSVLQVYNADPAARADTGPCLGD
jgi:S1-C subfamily serine protease